MLLTRCGFSTRAAVLPLAIFASTALVQGMIFVNQTPAPGGGVGRWSKLWVDPNGQNNLDGDAICYEDFTLANDSSINHIEWWGDGPPNQGFQIEFWKQDPGTIAYQPYAVFREQGAQPEFATTTTSYSFSGDPSGTTHYSFDFTSPVNLAANNASNPRWFVAVIGLTDVPYLEWNWAQGLGGSNRTFQFVRGGNEGGGDLYRALPEGRAMLLSGTAVPEPATLSVLGLGALALIRRRRGIK
ncbi:MAG: PEP-CTERM sorting domain-containing protein [Armatimonadetes bacterium]|nr:PEP-CTERM sorting domain-containing protein [Armatimonadota bacterium]